MITLTGLTEDNYFLPEDGMIAKKLFLDLMKMPTETWCSAYGFNMKDAFAIIKANDAIGVVYHLLLDYVQSQGPSAKPLVKDFNQTKKVSDITLTTAGIGSTRTSQIWHWKGFVKEASDGGEPYCWEGSVNFSDPGWLQGNSCRVFRSKIWADEFKRQHAIHKQWARDNQVSYQATILEVGGEIDAFFDSLNDGLSDTTIIDIITNPSLLTNDIALKAIQELAQIRGIA